jgi:hypothetical protein
MILATSFFILALIAVSEVVTAVGRVHTPSAAWTVEQIIAIARIYHTYLIIVNKIH